MVYFDNKNGIVGEIVDWKPTWKNQNDFMGWILGEPVWEAPKPKKVDITK